MSAVKLLPVVNAVVGTILVRVEVWKLWGRRKLGPQLGQKYATRVAFFVSEPLRSNGAKPKLSGPIVNDVIVPVTNAVDVVIPAGVNVPSIANVPPVKLNTPPLNEPPVAVMTNVSATV